VNLHPLLLTGSAISLITFFWAVFSLSTVMRKQNAQLQSFKIQYNLIFFAIFVWSAGAFLFRTASLHTINPLYLIIPVGPVLVALALSFLSLALQTGKPVNTRIHNGIILSLLLLSIALTVVFLLGPLVTDRWTLTSGLLRYQLTPSGHALFGLGFSVLFISAILYFIRSGFSLAARLIPSLLLLCGFGAVIIPYKELALPQFFFQAAFFFYLKGQLNRSV
jgi:hypothetical protein